jgi:hypothetical protein
VAKNELLKAEKLAPRNALVHYDLALAYSHTGQPQSAQLELNNALRLGLPATQKQAAEQMLGELARSTPTNATSAAEHNANTRQDGVSNPYSTISVTFDKFSNKSDGVLTLGFPQQHLALIFGTSCEGNDFSTKYHALGFAIKKGNEDMSAPPGEAIFLADSAAIHLPSTVLKNHSAIPAYLLRDIADASILEGRFDGRKYCSLQNRKNQSTNSSIKLICTSMGDFGICPRHAPQWNNLPVTFSLLPPRWRAGANMGESFRLAAGCFILTAWRDKLTAKHTPL